MSKPQSPMRRYGCCAAKARATVFALYPTWRRTLNVSLNKISAIQTVEQATYAGTKRRYARVSTGERNALFRGGLAVCLEMLIGLRCLIAWPQKASASNDRDAAEL